MRRRVAGGGLPSRASPGLASLASLAALPVVLAWLIAVALGLPHLHNDFHSYWYAGRLLAEGASPYDLDALRALVAHSGDDCMVGSGYSYPLPFAILMLPLAAMPFDLALLVFNGLSIVAFGLAVAWWLRRFHPTASSRQVRLAALLCGAWPPVIGSVVNGQVNLLILALVAAGAALVLEPSRARAAAGGVAIGLAAAVKLVPGALLVPLWLAGHRRAAVVGLLGGCLVPLVLAALILPAASLDSGRLTSLLLPDPFVTNQSVNGFVSRLVQGTDRMAPLAPGAFDPAPLSAVLTLGLAVATLAVLWRSRRCLAVPAGLAMGLALALAAATAGAPKTSLWNTSLLLVAAGLVLVTARPGAGASVGRLDRLERRLLVTWLVSAAAQPLVWLIPPVGSGPLVGPVVLLGSLALYGTLGLWGLAARRLVRLTVAMEARDVVPASAPRASALAS